MPSTTRSNRLGGRGARRESCAATSAALIATLDLILEQVVQAIWWLQFFLPSQLQVNSDIVELVYELLD
jgi:hypothetical protein